MAGKVDAKDDFYGEFRRHSTESPDRTGAL